ncbi:hypothetical protein DdX_13702 [Ditylenchus destructor]|uniref:Uncharacterized protein n=1 Tax=Ditylenchus destructor TaxID=166010 RepID=A0AAD4MVK3_9BILA|nr:hypothetical protein DdX_13702 [Ditylenchus destructor]
MTRKMTITILAISVFIVFLLVKNSDAVPAGLPKGEGTALDFDFDDPQGAVSDNSEVTTHVRAKRYGYGGGWGGGWGCRWCFRRRFFGYPRYGGYGYGGYGYYG